jgi:hypothetical protein
MVLVLKWKGIAIAKCSTPAAVLLVEPLTKSTNIRLGLMYYLATSSTQLGIVAENNIF